MNINLAWSEKITRVSFLKGSLIFFKKLERALTADAQI